MLTENEFPNVRESLSLMQRAYDEVTADLESTNTRAAVALTIVVAALGLVVFEVEVVSPDVLVHVPRWWVRIALLAAVITGYALMAVGAYEFIQVIRTRRAKTPYQLDNLVRQPTGQYRDPLLFHLVQLKAHSIACVDRQNLLTTKAEHFDAGLILAALGFAVLLTVSGTVWICRL